MAAARPRGGRRARCWGLTPESVFGKNHDMKRMIVIHLSIAALFASGCSTPPESNSPAVASENSTPPKTYSTVVDGSWHGREVTPGREGPASLTISGQTLEFHGADANDWLKGTFTLRDDTHPKQFVGVVTECAQPEYVGKKCCAIYKLEDGTLTATGNEPGDSNIPSAFDAAGSRQFVFKHEQ
jgi:uncharacterized protein (TIGR03067 family)